MTRVEVCLGHTIVPGVRRRDDFADPIGDDVDWALPPWLGQPFAAPPDHVGSHDIVRGKANVELVEDPPTARSTAPMVLIEGASDQPRVVRPNFVAITFSTSCLPNGLVR